MNISFIGAGNVAWHLAQEFENAGHSIIEIYSKDIQNARKLAAQLYDTVTQADLNFSESQSELFIIAVKDQVLGEVIEQLVLPEDVILINTSGTQSLEHLQHLINVHSDVQVSAGVLYPLQTFSKGEPLESRDIPFCVEAAEEETYSKLVSLAHSISSRVYPVESEERKVLHVAAVFANNFTNHFLSIAHDLMEREGLDFEMLEPLIRETFAKALQAENPSLAQTGPARRGDWEMTNVHLAYLQDFNPEWAKLYRNVSESIRLKHFGEAY